MKFKCLKPFMAIVLLAATLLCGACSGSYSATSLFFSFDTSDPADSGGEKILYINNGMEKLVLNAELKVDSGNVSLQVTDTATNDVIWNGEYSKDANFTIELNDLKANREYLLAIRAVQSRKVTLQVTSNTKLVKDKEKPDKYNI